MKEKIKETTIGTGKAKTEVKNKLDTKFIKKFLDLDEYKFKPIFDLFGLKIGSVGVLIEFIQRKALAFAHKDKQFHIYPLPVWIDRAKGFFIWWRVINMGSSSSTHESPLNPLPYWIHDWSWYLTEKILNLTGNRHLQCQGCGMGIIKWRITDPNMKENSSKKLLVCDDCVSFYDWHWSRQKIVSDKLLQRMIENEST